MNRRRNGVPPASRPRKTSGGIKAQSKRGAFEGFGLGTRLSRGRTYAWRCSLLNYMSEPPRRGRKPSEELQSAIVSLLSEAPITASTIQQRLAELPRDVPKASLPGIIKAAKSLAAIGYLKLTESRPALSGPGTRARTMYKATPQGQRLAKKHSKTRSPGPSQTGGGDGNA